jgi:hypothetical protein
MTLKKMRLLYYNSEDKMEISVGALTTKCSDA